jgi:type VI secretion system protein ImpB
VRLQQPTNNKTKSRSFEMNDSVQHKLKRVRPPRVKISYDVEIGDAVEKRELPFVGALIADLAGDNSDGQGKFSERKFVEVDNESVDEVMEGISPALSYTVDNKLAGGEGQINVALNFNSMADFQPKNIIEQVEPLKKLFEARQRLNDLSAKLDGNDELDNLLSQIIQNTDQREKIAGELASSAPADDKS